MRFFQKSFFVYVKLHHIFFSPWVNYAFKISSAAVFSWICFYCVAVFYCGLLWPFVMGRGLLWAFIIAVFEAFWGVFLRLFLAVVLGYSQGFKMRLYVALWLYVFMFMCLCLYMFLYVYMYMCMYVYMYLSIIENSKLKIDNW